MKKPVSFKAMKHQAYSLKHDASRAGVFDMSDPGTGKTFVRILAFAARRAKRGYGCLLVVAPKSLLFAAWLADFKKFAPHLKVVVATADNRAKAFGTDADVYVTNHDAVNWLVKQPQVFWNKFDELVVDESSAFKHHTSQRSKSLNRIRFPTPKITRFKHVALLCATPNSNSITDLWHQAFLIDRGHSIGPSFYAFRNAVSVPKQVGANKNAVNWTDKEGAEEAVFSSLLDMTVRHKIADCTDIPDTHIYTVPFLMTDKQAKAYTEMLKTHVLEIKKKRKAGESGAILALQASAVTTKLLQIASGAVYDGEKKYHVIDTSRYEAIIGMAEERIRQHPIVFFFWQHQKDLLVKEAQASKLRFAVIDGSVNDLNRNAIVLNYQAGNLDVLFAHPKTTVHGLTLTKGTSIIWSGPTYDAEWFVQGNRRQARIGQKLKTEVVVCVAEDTLEERVYNDVLMSKKGRMDNLLDLLDSLV